MSTSRPPLLGNAVAREWNARVPDLISIKSGVRVDVINLARVLIETQSRERLEQSHQGRRAWNIREPHMQSGIAREPRLMCSERIALQTEPRVSSTALFDCQNGLISSSIINIQNSSWNMPGDRHVAALALNLLAVSTVQLGFTKDTVIAAHPEEPVYTWI